MGSGETSPTMVKTHRELLQRLGEAPVAVLLDTPFGFQANHDELASRAVEYFATSVGFEIGVATYRSAAAASPLEYERMLARLREADYVFAGPGSPSYALRQWAGSLVPKVLSEKLATGGAITFASAAALTLGAVTVPVYEIYKVGEEPRWLDGLDLMAEAGLRVAVIPHYNNAEGGTHDTRFSYLGEHRLARLERELPDGTFVLGVDEHTGLILDLDAGSASVVGRGVVTIRLTGRSTELPPGTEVGIDELRGLGEHGRAPARPSTAVAPGRATTPGEPIAAETGTAGAGSSLATSPLLEAVQRYEDDFAAAVAGRRAEDAAAAVLALDDELHAWRADTLQSDELDRGRAALRSMIVRLGELAVAGARDPAEVIGPFVDELLARRAAARADHRYGEADAVRDRLTSLGVEVQDSPEGTRWRLLS